MKLTEKQLMRIIKEEIRVVQKNNIALLEQQLESVQKFTEENLKEYDDDANKQFLEHRNDIFVPILDETTGEKTYESRNFDQILAEMGDKALDRCDEIIDMLEESTNYERTLYFENEESDVINEVDWEKRAAEIEAGGETDDYDAEGRKKGVVQKVKGAYKKGKLYFFLKIVEQGLKAALALSRGLVNFIAKRLMSAIKKVIAAWASAKLKTSEVWQKIKEWGMTKLEGIMKAVMKPFMWIATKISSSAKQAADLAPLLLSITVLSLSIAYLYVTGGFAIFRSSTAGVQQAMQEVVQQNPSLCESKNLITELELEQECLFIDTAGNEVSNEVMVEVAQRLTKDINEKIDEVTASVYTAVSEWQSTGAAPETGFEKEAWKFGEKLVDQKIEALKTIQGELYGTNISGLTGLEGELNLAKMDASGLGFGKEVSLIQKMISAVQKEAADGKLTLTPLSDKEAMTMFPDFTVAVSEEYVSYVQEGVKDGVDYAYEITKTIGVQRVVGVSMPSAPSVKEGYLAEGAIKRFKKLSGIV